MSERIEIDESQMENFFRSIVIYKKKGIFCNSSYKALACNFVDTLVIDMTAESIHTKLKQMASKR